MAEFRPAGVFFLLVFCVPAICSIYVIPEHSINQLDKLDMKVQTRAFNSNDASAPSYSSVVIDSSGGGNGQINKAMLAKTSQRRQHQTSYDKNDDVVDAATVAGALDDGVNDSNNNNNGPSIFENTEKTTQTSLNDAKHKEENMVDANTQLISRQRRELADWLIAPNTRWCGRGNSANGTYNHLGGASRADKCCRKHDHCRLFIPAMSNRYGLFNYLPYTLSHCNCDIRFRTCLKMAGGEDANTIGQLYFNMVDTHCFVLVKEHICQQRAPDGTCVQDHIKKKAQLRSNKKF